MKGGCTMKIRKAQFSGSWYPGDAADCEREITSFIKSGKEATESDRPLVGGIVPHAGWYFSGSIACNVIHRLQGEKQPYVFVVFGMHLHTRSPNYIMIEGAWETPFGNLEIEEDLAGELTKQFKFNIESADRFTPDNTIELQLPFIKYFFNDTKLVPIGVPPNRESLRIGQAVADYGKSKGLEMRIIGSTDLTHYGTNYGFMPKGTGPEGHIALAQSLNPPARPFAHAIRVQEQWHHHLRRIRCSAAAVPPIFSIEWLQVHLFHRIHHEASQIAFWNPVTDVRRQ